ncbi:MAG: Gfo/Idh/MocA family protein, partial [Verrucomicrobiota bacterium]
MAKKYAIVGVGSRSRMYSKALLDKYAGHSKLVAVCDRNPGRLNLALSKCTEAGAETKGYPAGEFEKMIRETQPDTVIVTTVDRYHDDYICKAMEMGCDTITEKPMTISEQKCQRIIDTCRKTRRDCRVTFNYRYSPPRTQIK